MIYVEVELWYAGEFIFRLGESFFPTCDQTSVVKKKLLLANSPTDLILVRKDSNGRGLRDAGRPSRHGAVVSTVVTKPWSTCQRVEASSLFRNIKALLARHRLCVIDLPARLEPSSNPSDFRLSSEFIPGSTFPLGAFPDPARDVPDY